MIMCTVKTNIIDHVFFSACACLFLGWCGVVCFDLFVCLLAFMFACLLVYLPVCLPACFLIVLLLAWLFVLDVSLRLVVCSGPCKANITTTVEAQKYNEMTVVFVKSLIFLHVSHWQLKGLPKQKDSSCNRTTIDNIWKSCPWITGMRIRNACIRFGVFETILWQVFLV